MGPWKRLFFIGAIFFPKVVSFWVGTRQFSAGKFKLDDDDVRPSPTALFSGITIYGHPGTRSPLINWACYELGLTDVAAGDLNRNPHPFGQIPCVTDDDGEIVVFESGAILQYLHQTYAAKSTKANSAAVTSWIVWANASLDPICFLETPDGKVYDTGLRHPPNRRVDQLESILRANKEKGSLWLVPELGFSTADVAVGSYLLYVLQFFPDIVSSMLPQWPTVVLYMNKCAERPEYGQAFGTAAQIELLQRLQVAKTLQ